MFMPQVLLAASLLNSLKFTDSSYWQPVPIKFVGNTIKRALDEINFCDKHVCVADASRMGLWMNHTKKPCEDFYEYVCGAFLYHVSR